MKAITLALAFLGTTVITSDMLCDYSYGTVIEVDNRYQGVLYIASTDPNPGSFNGAPGGRISEIQNGDTILNDQEAKFHVPWENYGGKMYVWLKDYNGRTVSAAMLHDRNDIVYFAGDTGLVANPNVVAGQASKAACQNNNSTMFVKDVHIKITTTPQGQIQCFFKCPGWAKGTWESNIPTK